MNDTTTQSIYPYYEDAWLGLALDVRHMRISEADVREAAPMIRRALEDMEALESGAIANPTEGRRVGHYWLRAPELAPEPELTRAIDEARDADDA